VGRILITGGFGYVGGRITRHLGRLRAPVNLRVLSRRDLERVPPWAGSVEVVRGDLRDLVALTTAVAGVQAVIHLAAPDEVMSRKDPDEALEVTGQGTHRLLQASLEGGVRRFLYFSTFHVYGPWARGRITEETATRPVHPYAITHRLAEDYVNWFRHEHGLETLILRLSNAIGCPADPLVDRWTLVFNDLCRQAVLSGHLRLRSDGSQVRDFITLTDVARAIEHCLDLPDWGDGLFNLGSDGPCQCSSWPKLLQRRTLTPGVSEWRSSTGRGGPASRPPRSSFASRSCSQRDLSSGGAFSKRRSAHLS